MLLACTLAWFAKAYHTRRREDWAIAQLPTGVGHPKLEGTACPWPLSTIVGENFFKHARSLQVWYYNKETCKLIADFPFLEAVHIRVEESPDEQLSNSDLKCFQGHRHIYDLRIEGRCFDDHSLSHFSASRPRRIVLRYLRCSGYGLESFASDRLTTLSLYRTPVTDDGLRSLQRFRNLQYLEIHGGDITDNALKSLSGLDNLELIALTNVGVHDIGLSYLPRSIRRLRLRFLPITDKGIEHLAGMQLQQLDLIHTDVTPAGIERLRRMLPSCKYRLVRNQGVKNTGGRIGIERYFGGYPNRK